MASESSLTFGLVSRKFEFNSIGLQGLNILRFILMREGFPDEHQRYIEVL